jgi:hypothetical protein
MNKPKYHRGQKFRMGSDGSRFEIENVRVLAPDDRIGYELRGLEEPFQGMVLHRFEAELERDFELEPEPPKEDPA